MMNRGFDCMRYITGFFLGKGFHSDVGLFAVYEILSYTRRQQGNRVPNSPLQAKFNMHSTLNQ